ncbi:flagellar filament capping protein FliD [Sphingomonas flavalba]|uniref:flagellar filament capping protein FliD n=1 Tax=Sphingomonas flavalba TaxID=2559804 RepID=UPI00109D95AE|nr:flagellar filament capping protein FliD [Sphingomonas flavalba]
MTTTSITSALGVGAGIDTAKLVSDLISAQFDGKAKALADQDSALTARISAVSALKSGISSFSTSLNSLLASGMLMTQPVSSDTGIVTSSALAGAHLGNFAAEVEVRQLAAGQLLTSAPVAAGRTAPVGTGSLTFTFGAASWADTAMTGFAADPDRAPVTIAIGSDNNSLAGIAQAINAANIGVTATIVAGEGGASLSLKGPTGAAMAFTVDVAETPGDEGLAALAFNPGAAGMTLGRKAVDSIVAVDGIVAQRATNSIDDLIPGVQLNLIKAAAGTTVSLTAKRPTDAIGQAVNDFASAYNELKSLLKTDTDPKTGMLNGDPAVRAMAQRLATLTSTQLLANVPAGAPKTLAEIGVRTNRDGTLSVDSAALNKALANWPDVVEAMFNPSQTSASPLLSVTSAPGKTALGTYAVTDVVAAAGDQPASGMIAGKPATAIGDLLYAAADSAAAGLVLKVSGNVTATTVSIDLGLGALMEQLAAQITSKTDGLGASTDRYTRQRAALADRQDELQTRQDQAREQMTRQFASMDARVAAYKATQSFLEQQVKIWTNANGN